MCLLLRTIYRLKEIPHAWFMKISPLLFVYIFIQCSINHIVKWKNISSGIVILVIDFYNICLTGSDEASILAMEAYIHQYSRHMRRGNTSLLSCRV